MAQADDWWHAGCNPSVWLYLSPIPHLRRTIMRIFVATLALALAAGSASASQLDLQPGPLSAGTGQYAQYNDLGASKTLLANDNGPIRHRRPWRDRDRDYNDGYRRQAPQYFA